MEQEEIHAKQEKVRYEFAACTAAAKKRGDSAAETQCKETAKAKVLKVVSRSFVTCSPVQSNHKLMEGTMAKRKRKQKGSIWKSHGSWYIRYREPDGTPVAYKLGSVKDYPRKGDVLYSASRYMERVNQSIAAEKNLAAGAPVGTVGEFYETVFLPEKRRTVDSKTLRYYGQCWRLYLESHLGKMRLRDVTTGAMQRVLRAIHAEQSDRLSHDYYALIKVTASAIFSEALIAELILVNPVHGTKTKGMGHYNHRENGAYTLKEIQQFLTLFSAEPHIAATIGVNAFLGLRRPEIEALRPEHYNGATMYVPHPKVRGMKHFLYNDPLSPIF
jgi:hypothetical protein